MSIQTAQFVRKTFTVDAVRVTAENIEEVAQWCNGVVTVSGAGKSYIHVRVLRPTSLRQTQAYIGDWVVYASKGYKVYDNKSWEKSFEPTKSSENKKWTTTLSAQYLSDDSGECKDTAFVISDREEAQTVLDTMRKHIPKYGSVTIEDLYNLIGVKSTFKSHRWGWVKLPEDILIREVDGGGFTIDFPEPERLV